MALSAPTIRQKRFAGVLAWERGKKIAVWPETSSGLSGLIAGLMEMPALAITEKQVEIIRGLVVDCVASVPGFDPAEFSELPEDRATGNRMISTLKRVLNPPEKTRAEFVQARDSFDAYLVGESDATPDADHVAASVVTDEEVPF